MNPTRTTRHGRLVVAALALAMPVGAAASVDPLIDGARQCTQHFPVEEKRKNIPTHLLAAIATTESGRYHKGLGMSVPWPWTINVDGKGYYFNSKAEAIAQTQNLIASGRRSIDVGCMQVNLKHHPKAFANLNQAFDPAANVAYAATFLHDNYATLGDWIKATAAYHSRTPVYGQKYLLDIERSWNRIVGKVAQARASKSGGVAMARADASPPAATARAQQAPRVIRAASPMREARQVRVIQVNDASTRARSEVLVVRADAAPRVAAARPLAVADASDSGVIMPTATSPAAPVPAPERGDSVRRVSLDSKAVSALPVAQADGARFIFAN